MPSSTTTEDFPMLPTLNGFDGFSSNGFGMPELGLTSLFDLDQSREITKTSFTPTESMRDQEEEEIIELQEPENTRKTFSISRPRLTSDTKVRTGATLNKEIKSEEPPTNKYGDNSRPTLSEASAKGNYVKPHKIKKMSRIKLSTYAPSVVTTPKSVSFF
jgi:hypothetical protein